MTGTVLDRVNPVTRLGAAMILTFPLLTTVDWLSATVTVIVELGIAAWINRAQLPRPRAMIRRGLPFLIAAPLAGLSLLLYGDPGGRIHWTWGLIVISDQSIGYGLAVTARVVALGMACLVTLSGVDPTDMADGLAQVWHWPARFVIGALAGVRMISQLSADWQAMKLARRARGLGDSGAVRRFFTAAFALLVSAIRRGSVLATAMEARGFGRGERTWARRSTVGRADVVCLLVATAVVGLGLGCSAVTGHFHWIGDIV
ncbi:MAG: energy-coupling factor transporter transmembrane protein EcfT [Propionibacteriaceae bacterium]|jgi:energy-coupling factor transport system permease protein|nr:energy-coupling factor transporter transmembrane protein EcfT [Propionibacteriaceae bacterium]